MVRQVWLQKHTFCGFSILLYSLAGKARVAKPLELLRSRLRLRPSTSFTGLFLPLLVSKGNALGTRFRAISNDYIASFLAAWGVSHERRSKRRGTIRNACFCRLMISQLSNTSITLDIFIN